MSGSTKGVKLFYLNSNHYPKNSFLEELNKKENIDKLFSKIENKYISFYSIITGENGKNNIISFDLTDLWHYTNGKYVELIDETFKHIGQDIYDGYIVNKKSDYYYMIKNIIRNSTGLGGDGTVPSYNLRLVPNDSVDGKEIKNPKFESKNIDCSLDIYRGFGINTKNEACSHTNMPFLTSLKVVDFISGSENTNFERKKLIENFGYALYLLNYNYKANKIAGIQNNTLIGTYFTDKYYKKMNNLSNDKFSLALPDKTLSYRIYEILSPINILITDEEGRKIGIDRESGNIINEIPGAWTSGDSGASGEREFIIIPSIKGEKMV